MEYGVQAAAGHLARGGALVEATLVKLRHRHDPVLLGGEASQSPEIGVLFSRYVRTRNAAASFAPCPALERCGAVNVGAYEGPRQRLFAVRGATQAEANEPEAILAATEALLRELIERNGLEPEAMVSCLFTTTDDLDAEFPAVAARKLGFDRVPLLCAREVPVPGAPGRIIRVLIHYYAGESHRAQHVYLGEARTLRTDLESAQ
jgi:chorismate mutase